MHVDLDIVISRGVFAVLLDLNSLHCGIVRIFSIAGLRSCMTRRSCLNSEHLPRDFSLTPVHQKMCSLAHSTFSVPARFSGWVEGSLLGKQTHNRKYGSPVNFSWASEGWLLRGGAIWPGPWRISKSLPCGEWGRYHVPVSGVMEGVWHEWSKGQCDQNIGMKGWNGRGWSWGRVEADSPALWFHLSCRREPVDGF